MQKAPIFILLQYLSLHNCKENGQEKHLLLREASWVLDKVTCKGPFQLKHKSMFF